MSVSLVIPYRSDGAERDRNWAWLRKRYERLFPEWEIIEHDSFTLPWNKPEAVNRGVQESSGDVLVIADADVVASPFAIQAALEFLDSSAWILPHAGVWRLNEETTLGVIEGRITDEPDALGLAQIAALPRIPTPGGGMTVIRRSDFIPMDERFVEWGGEDAAWGYALDTLLGTHRKLPYPVWHLWHEPMPMRDGRRTFHVESEVLVDRYYMAHGKPDKMKALTEEALEPA